MRLQISSLKACFVITSLFRRCSAEEQTCSLIFSNSQNISRSKCKRIEHFTTKESTDVLRSHIGMKILFLVVLLLLLCRLFLGSFSNLCGPMLLILPV